MNFNNYLRASLAELPSVLEVRNIGSAGYAGLTHLIFVRIIIYSVVNVLLTQPILVPKSKVPFFKRNRLSLKRL